MAPLQSASETTGDDSSLVGADSGAGLEGETLVSGPSATQGAGDAGGSFSQEQSPERVVTNASRGRGVQQQTLLTSRNLLLGSLLLVGSVLLVVGAATLMRDSSRFDQPLVHYTVRRGNLKITVTDRGNLQSQNDIKVICEVDDIDGDGVRGTPILWVIPNGSSVKEGDLLVELDVSNHQERLDRQILDTEKARAETIKAKVQYENQKTQNQTNLAEAELQVRLAELALQQFEDEEGGTFQIGLQDVELQIQEAQSSRLIQQTNLEGVEQLYKLGYRSRGELAEARLSALRAERQLAAALSKKKEMVEYQYRKTKLELEGSLASAKRSLEQVQRDNEALLEQARAAMEAEERGLTKEEERLERYREQITRAKIYAPQDGMVAYLGYPVFWPDGKLFGTLCAVDTKENRWGKRCEDLLSTFKTAIEAHLALVDLMEQMKRKNEALEHALSEVKTLQGLLPICASCKKIRDDKGYWNQIESYLSQHTEVTFSHGICPGCERKLYSDLLESGLKSERVSEKSS